MKDKRKSEKPVLIGKGTTLEFITTPALADIEVGAEVIIDGIRCVVTRKEIETDPAKELEVILTFKKLP